MTFGSKFMQTCAIGLCIVAGSAGMASAYAVTLNEAGLQMERPMQADNYNYLIQKQQEIDQYLFSNHAAEVAQRGFKVTHTGPRDSYIEIGITPFSEKNAQYLYEIFGQDLIKVVEGQQAVLLETPDLVAPDTPVSSDMETDSTSSSPNIRIRVNGEDIAMEAAPFIENGRTLIPLRGVMEKLGAVVNWDAPAQKAEVVTAEKKLIFHIGQKAVQIVYNNNEIATEETVQLDVPAQIKDNYTYIPARFASENLGATVAWDETSRLVSIIMGGSSNYEEEMKKEVIGIRGTVTEITRDAANQIASIRVEGKTESDTGYDKAIVKISADTVVFREGTGERIAVNDLAQGDVVEIVFAGGVNESYPVQGGAKFVKVIQGDMLPNQEEVGPSLTEMGKALAADSVQKMELYSLRDEKIKTFNQDEVEQIISQLNTSPTYLGVHILMLAGNNIKITFKDNTGVSLTSYGFEDHVVLAGQINGENVSYCLICPEVGRILLAQ